MLLMYCMQRNIQKIKTFKSYRNNGKTDISNDPAFSKSFFIQRLSTYLIDRD